MITGILLAAFKSLSLSPPPPQKNSSFLFILPKTKGKQKERVLVRQGSKMDHACSMRACDEWTGDKMMCL